MSESTLETTEILLIVTLALVTLMFLWNFEMYRNILFLTESVKTEPNPPVTLRTFVADAVHRAKQK